MTRDSTVPPRSLFSSSKHTAPTITSRSSRHRFLPRWLCSQLLWSVGWYPVYRHMLVWIRYISIPCLYSWHPTLSRWFTFCKMCVYFSCLSFVTKIFGTEVYRNEVLPSFRKLRPQLIPQYAHKTLMSVFECAVFWTQLPPNSNANSVFLLPFSGYKSRAAVSVVVHVNGDWYNRLRENQSTAGCTKSQLPITSEIIPWWEYSDIHRRQKL